MPTSPLVEVAFATTPFASSPTWTNITRYVRKASGITVNRGLSDELPNVQAGRMSLTVDNTDGRFTTGNATSPYWPNVKRNRRIRWRQVHVETNLVQNPTFETNVDNWDPNGTPLPTRAVSSTRAHQGTKSMLITWGTGAGGDVRAGVYGLDIGSVYTVAAWVWVPSGGAPAVRLGIAGGATGTASSTTNAWQQITVTFTATEVTHTVTISASTAPTSGHQVWVDEVMAAAGASAATFSSTGAVVSSRFNGFVSKWPVDWPRGGKEALTALSAVDLLAPLDRDELASMLEEEVLLDSPGAYYPMSEPAGSTSVGDSSGMLAGELTVTQVGGGGDLTFGGGTGPGEDGLSCPLFAPTSASAGLYLVGDLGADYESASSTGYVAVEAWFSTAVKNRKLCGMASSNFDYQLSIGVDNNGDLEIEYWYRTPDTEELTHEIATWPTSDLANNAVHHLVYDEATSTVWIDGVSQGTQTRPLMYRMRQFYVGGYRAADLWDGSIAHVAAYTYTVSGMPSARIDAHYDAGVTGFAGEAADDRIQRIAGYTGIVGTITTQGTLFDPVASQGAGAKTPLAMMRDVATSESGRLLAGRDDGLIYQSRDLRYNRAASLTISANDTEGLRLADDDQFVTNRVTASRPGGAQIRLVDEASIANYGVYPRGPLTLLKTSDAAVVDTAQWYLNRYAEPALRLQDVTVEGATLGTTAYRALLGVDVSDSITFTDLQPQAPSSSTTAVVEGYVETAGDGQHTWKFHSSPAVVDQVWQLNSSTFSVLGTSTRLAY